VAGLAIVARAASFTRADWFDPGLDDEEQQGDRAAIEVLCAFCGVTPLPAEV
jgi:hypothetical protein